MGDARLGSGEPGSLRRFLSAGTFVRHRSWSEGLQPADASLSDVGGENQCYPRDLLPGLKVPSKFSSEINPLKLSSGSLTHLIPPILLSPSLDGETDFLEMVAALSKQVKLARLCNLYVMI